jgi:hypothetical protein
VAADLTESRALVCADCALIEASDIQHNSLWPEQRSREVNTGTYKRGSEPLSGQIGAQSQAEKDRAPALLEVEEAGYRPITGRDAVKAFRVVR